MLSVDGAFLVAKLKYAHLDLPRNTVDTEKKILKSYFLLIPHKLIKVFVKLI